MLTHLIHDRGRGPELVGTRITVYNLLPDLLDPTATEAYICQVYHLSAEQVAAARAYILCNPDTVLAEHLKIEQRIAQGNPPEVVARAEEIRNLFGQFRQWLAERESTDAVANETGQKKGASGRFPSFRDWLAGHESGTMQAP